MEKFREYEEVLKTRYINLYGNNDYDQWLKKQRNRMTVMISVTVLLMLCVICNDIAASRNEYSNVTLGKNGEIISVTRPEKGQDSYSFTSRVRVILEEEEYEKEYYITIEPIDEEENVMQENIIPEIPEKDTAEIQLKKMISALNEDTGTVEVILPQKLKNGGEIIWMKADNTDPVIYVISMIIMICLIYSGRFHAISKEEKRARESIIKELPEFINKLVLLINAGVILNTAFLKVVEECDEKRVKSSYFYRRISDIGYMVKETNASFYKEMYSFAKHSGVKELMRITNIMMDNINKGDDLSDKLRRENELLWFARKQQAEEKGRLAETKLTLPLMILLTVLIVVTISPALMEI